jgi:hypothetical protein
MTGRTAVPAVIVIVSGIEGGELKKEYAHEQDAQERRSADWAQGQHVSQVEYTLRVTSLHHRRTGGRRRIA